jgi:periplasmic copper chaperone A
MRLALPALILALSAAGAAQAHVSISPREAQAGAYQVVRVGLGHGCDGQATTALRIEIPPGVVSARPQPKPGWTLAIERSGGEAVRAITWRGRLPADQYEEFLIQLHLPAEPGVLAFPAVQTCGKTIVRWDESATNGARPKRPAPILTLTRPGEAEHHH